MAESVGNESLRMTMQQFRILIGGPGSGPGRNGGPGILVRILLSIAAVIMLAAAAFLGAIFFLAALGMFVIGSLVLAARIWWARRRIEKAMSQGKPPQRDSPVRGGHPDVIEGEYRVVEEGRRHDGAEQGPGGER